MSSRILTSAIAGIKAASSAAPAMAAARAAGVAMGGAGAACPRAALSVAAGAPGSALFSVPSFKLPDLSYDYGALEPFISGEIMRIHHTKHHQVSCCLTLAASLLDLGQLEAVCHVTW